MGINGVDVPVAGPIAINDNFVLREQAIVGAGIVRLPEYFVRKAISNNQLTVLLGPEIIQGQSIYILQPQLLYPSQKSLNLLSLLKNT